MLRIIAHTAKAVMIGSAATFMVRMVWALSQTPQQPPQGFDVALVFIISISAIISGLALIGSDPE